MPYTHASSIFLMLRIYCLLSSTVYVIHIVFTEINNRKLNMLSKKAETGKTLLLTLHLSNCLVYFLGLCPRKFICKLSFFKVTSLSSLNIISLLPFKTFSFMLPYNVIRFTPSKAPFLKSTISFDRVARLALS